MKTCLKYSGILIHRSREVKRKLIQLLLKYFYEYGEHSGNGHYLFPVRGIASQPNLPDPLIRLNDILMTPPLKSIWLAVNFIYFRVYALLAMTDTLSVTPENHLVPQKSSALLPRR